MRTLIVAVVAVLLVASSAEAAPRLRVSVPAQAIVRSKVAVKVSGPRRGKVRVYFLTRTKRRRSDKPVARGSLRHRKLTLRIKVPARARTYRVLACLEGRRLRCAAAKKLRVVAPATGVLSPPPPPPVPAPVVTPAGRPAANPLTVALAPERGRTASARVGPDGGSVTATGADGTIFRVTLAPGALAAPETIAVTPAGGAVLLEPVGLAFAHPADVAIAAGGDPLGWVAREDGSEAHLVPVSVDGAGALHVSLRRLAPVGVTGDLDGFAAHAPTGEADVALQRIAVAQARWARGGLSAAARDAEVARAVERWRTFLSADVDATPELLAWQDAGGNDASLRAAHARALTAEADRASAACAGGDWLAMGRLLLLAHLDRELGYGLGIDGERLTRCGRFSIERTVTYTSDTAAFSDADWDYGPTHRSYATHATGSLTYARPDADLRAVLATDASDWKLSRHAVAKNQDCERDWRPLDRFETGTTRVVFDVSANLGVERAPVLRVTDGGHGITLRGIDEGNDGIDCGPAAPIDQPAAPGAAEVPLDRSGHGTVRDAAGHSVTSVTLVPMSG